MILTFFRELFPHIIQEFLNISSSSIGELCSTFPGFFLPVILREVPPKTNPDDHPRSIPGILQQTTSESPAGIPLEVSQEIHLEIPCDIHPGAHTKISIGLSPRISPVLFKNTFRRGTSKYYRTEPLKKIENLEKKNAYEGNFRGNF